MMAPHSPEKHSAESRLPAKKYEIEQALKTEQEDIRAGRLKEDNPLEWGEDFRQLCEAARRGDLKVCQEKIQQGININARDPFDYTPLILVSIPHRFLPAPAFTCCA